MYILYTYSSYKIIFEIYYNFIVLILISIQIFLCISRPDLFQPIYRSSTVLPSLLPFFFFASNGYWGFSRNNATYTLRDISCAHVILTHGPLLRRLYRATPTADLLNEIGFLFERVFYAQNSGEGWLMKWMTFR